MENVNPNDNIHYCVIDCHGNSLLHFGLNTKVSCEGVLGGGGFKLFWNINISMIMQSSTVKFHIYCFYMVIIWPSKYVR